MIDDMTKEVEILAYKYMESQDDETVFDYLQDTDGKVRTIAGKSIQLRGSDELFYQVISLKNAQNIIFVNFVRLFWVSLKQLIKTFWHKFHRFYWHYPKITVSALRRPPFMRWDIFMVAIP